MIDFLKAIWETAKASKKWWLILIASIITVCVILFSILTGCQTAKTEVYTHGGTVSVNTEQVKPTTLEARLNASYREADRMRGDLHE